MPKNNREMKSVNLYLEAATIAALDDYADSVGLSRSQAANSILASTIRDDVPALQAVVDAWKGIRARQRTEGAAVPA